ncbi:MULTISPECIES: hypothetical protein [Bacillaceae]|uniref:hypothetical protein n=1 Tax=Bacillaceae TaxID=186817 RepID=UPI00296468B3|nr:hypothetical protein [Bacillus infantis]MDW2876596.1 hypothetical protein [Bacillus infantis]
MIYYVQLVRGILNPSGAFYQLGKAEEIRGLVKRLILLILAGAMIFAAYGYLGMGMEFLHREITSIGSAEFEMKKLFAIIGQTCWGIIYTCLILFLQAVLFWIFMDVEYKKLLVVQAFVSVIFLAEKVLLLPITAVFGTGGKSSPFSLGIISQYIFENGFLTKLFSMVTIFSIAVIIFQYKALKSITEKSPKLILIVVILINLLYWTVSAVFFQLQIEKLI